MAKTEFATFDKQLKDALKRYDDPARLDAESPLATAYFLGVTAHDETPAHWGELLRQMLLQAAHTLWGETPPRRRDEIEAAWSEIIAAPGTPRYSYLVLELRYFRQFFRPRSLQQIWDEFLQQSRAEFYRDVDQAVTDLGDALLRLLRPGARVEPPPVTEPLVGRTELLQRIAAALTAGNSVALSGAAGAGKSSVAAVVADRWPSPVRFWFTVRAELNDRLYQLLYALGAFLHQHGAGSLWRALVANQGRLEDPALLLTLASRDLRDLHDQRPLLILDEVDLWADDSDDATQVHAFVAGLQEAASVLLVGQRVEQAAHVHLVLDALTPDDTQALLLRNGLALSPAEQTRLHSETGGNPRLLWLCLDLLRQGDALDDILSGEGTHARPFESYLNRLRQRLDDAGRTLLNALAVYPGYAPVDPWPAVQLAQLRTRHLLTLDGRGGVALLPGVRNVVLRSLSAEQREELHQAAAAVHAARAEYTLAAFHLHHGARPEPAVKLWFPRRATEIAQGQAATAATIFHNISRARLSKPTQRLLEVIRAELFHLSGNLQAGLDALPAADSADTVDELALDVARLRGDFLDALGRPEEALATYTGALGAAVELHARMVDLHRRKGMVHVRQRQLAAAWRTAHQARYQAEHLHGLILEQQGDMAAAEQHYAAALELATTAGDDDARAEANRCLCNLHGRRGELAVACRHADDAIAHYERTGNLVQTALVRSNLAAAYLDVGQHEAVLTTALPAFEFFYEHGFTHRWAGTACNLAEAHFELGNWEAAEHYADLALRAEEPLAIPYAAYTLALVQQARGNAAAGMRWLDLCRSMAQSNEDIFIEAYAWLKTAELLDADGRAAPAQRAEAAGRAQTLFQRQGMDALAAQAAQWLP